MDAKPQRPVRVLRIHDENAPPQVPIGKTLHSRNKSTPALSTMTQVGGLRAQAAKRTVFADRSNAPKQPIAKDDMQVPGKGFKKEMFQDSVTVSAKELTKPAALVRPSQRTITNTFPLVHASNGAHHIPAVLPKHVTKKVSTVFRDNHSDSIAELINAAATRKPLPSVAESTNHIARTSLVTEPTHQPATHEQVLSLAPVEQKAQRDEEKVAPESRYLPDETNQVEEKYEYLDALEEQARAIEQERNNELAKAARLEPEEYWDEDDDEIEEYFDADGYTTARSIRSRGDNTTGGVTLLLAPRITLKSQRELEVAKQWVDTNKSPEDVEDEQWDTSMVAEYGEEIFSYMHDLEERLKPNATYMDHQSEIQWSMRSVLMDWLVQVHNRFTLLPETLFLAVNYVDRFLSAKVVSLGKLQLVGATALFVAAKYEEINCPSVQEIVYMVDGAYTADEVLKAERFMLSMLQFELGWPGPMSFLRRISKADDYDLETRTLAKYFLEITIMDERFVGCSPSFLSAGAHCLARFMLKKGDWSLAHVHYSGYTLQQIANLVMIMLECCENPQKHHAAVYEKYTDKRYKRASIFVETELSKGFQLSFASRSSLAGQSLTWKRK
ncbi:cyclin-like protein [Dendryphion nanum]|uniref:Cyclin-like protein n=1 Tax=Dendryphion nanum TaxID=256645 RepID=A0A9P9IRL3_9PLEO|nr:cyclin-like protein [Dendryphion nanum]